VHKRNDTYTSKSYLGSGLALKTAIKKYGRKHFTRTTLTEFSCAKNAFLAEAEMVNADFIKRLDTYNMKLGGEGGTGVKHTEETKAKIAAAGKGRVKSEETRAKHSNYKHTEETKAKLSALNKGKVLTEEHIAKMRVAGSLPVIIYGEFHTSIKKAAEFNEMSDATMGRRIKSSNPKWAEWRLATKEEIASFWEAASLEV
jgi:group I intron endonuclease